jgi:hypothetical protein
VREEMSGRHSGSIPFKHNFERMHQGRVLRSALQTHSRAPCARGNSDMPTRQTLIYANAALVKKRNWFASRPIVILDSPGVAAATAAPLRLASPAASEPLMPLLKHTKFNFIPHAKAKIANVIGNEWLYQSKCFIVFIHVAFIEVFKCTLK